MPILAIQFPDIDPVLIHISIRWYALAYIAGLVLGWLYLRGTVSNTKLWFEPDSGVPIATKPQIDDFLVWATLGVLLGGRIGWVVFVALLQNPSEILANPLQVFYVWEGGMNFHGGLIGVFLVTVLFCRRNKIDLLRFGDAIACATPFGLGFGRIANFINGEIWGKVSGAPWAVIPCNKYMRQAPGGCRYGEEPRLPVQLYEAFLEGLVLFVVLFVLTRTFKGLRRPGLAIGVFLIGYAAFRIFVEVMYRDSDNKLFGEHSGWTVGIVFSLPMPIIGLLFIWQAYKDRLGPLPFASALARLFKASPAKPEAAGKK
jgi:phosphatidylglycerol:prolipoprotein diacylglycerol transferase